MNKMDEKYLVSIIIPVYNGSDYVAYAIKSAVNQTYKNLEIIVVFADWKTIFVFWA